MDSENLDVCFSVYINIIIQSGMKSCQSGLKSGPSVLRSSRDYYIFVQLAEREIYYVSNRQIRDKDKHNHEFDTKVSKAS